MSGYDQSTGRFKLTFLKAHYWYRRDPLQRPLEMEGFASLLRDWGLEVFEVRKRFLVTESYVSTIWECLSGVPADPAKAAFYGVASGHKPGVQRLISASHRRSHSSEVKGVSEPSGKGGAAGPASAPERGRTSPGPATTVVADLANLTTNDEPRETRIDGEDQVTPPFQTVKFTKAHRK